MSLATNKVLRTIARIFEIIVGIVFIVASGLKAFNPAAFADQIISYHVVPAQWALFLAWFFIAIEFVFAVAIIFNLKPKLFIPLMMLVLLAFIGVTVFTIMNGLKTDCGCFGNVVHRTSQQVIIEDALMFIALLFSFLVLYDEKFSSSWTKTFIMNAASIAVILLVTGFSNRLPVDSLVTELKTGKYFSSWPVENLYLDLNKDRRIVFLFSTSLPGIEGITTHMNAIAQTENMPTTIGLITDGSQQLTTLVFQYGVAFPVGALEPRFAKNLYRTLPRTFILENGVVKKVWNGIPSPDEVKSSLILMKK